MKSKKRWLTGRRGSLGFIGSDRRGWHKTFKLFHRTLSLGWVRDGHAPLS